MYCPSKRNSSTEPRLSISGDKPDVGFPGSKSHYPGSLGDYAACVGSDLLEDYHRFGGDGAIVIASWPWNYQNRSPPYRLAPWKSQTRFSSITDGLSNTIFLGEKHLIPGTFGVTTSFSLGIPEFGDGSIYNGDHPWNMARAAGERNLLARNRWEMFGAQFGSWHSGIVPFSMGDGSVRQIDVDISGRTLGILSRRSDGEIE